MPPARVNSESRESKVDDLCIKENDLIPNRTFFTTRKIRYRTFPSKDMSQRTVVKVIKQKKNTQKKQTQRRLRRHPSALARLLLTPRIRHFFLIVMEIWKNAAASIQKRCRVPYPEDVLHSRQGTAQGGPLSMAVYALSTLQLISKLSQQNWTQTWFADCAGGRASLQGPSSMMDRSVRSLPKLRVLR